MNSRDHRKQNALVLGALKVVGSRVLKALSSSSSSSSCSGSHNGSRMRYGTSSDAKAAETPESWREETGGWKHRCCDSLLMIRAGVG